MAFAGALVAAAACAEPAASGEAYVLSKSYETQSWRGGGSSGSSQGRDELLERVILARAGGGVEVEYDLPRDTAAEDRARQWTFPVRVLKTPGGGMQLLNGAELEARLEAWLAAGGLTRAACGRWGFSWTAYRVECDVPSVLKTVAAFDPRPAGELREGTAHREAGALGSGALARTSAHTFTAVLEVDPEAVRREGAEADVVVGEILRKPVTLEAALAERAKQRVSGTLTVTFDMDRAGTVWRRTRVTRLETTTADGGPETRMASETVERRPVRAER